MKLSWTDSLILRLCICILGIVQPGPLAQGSVTAAPQSMILPVFGPDTNGFIGLSFVNTSSTKNEITVTWTDADGNRSRATSLSLAPGSQRVALVREILALPEDPIQGWLRIDASEPGLLSYMSSGAESVLDGTEAASLTGTRIVLPHVAVSTGFMELGHTDTLVNLTNPGTSAANARAELIGLDGIAAGAVTIAVPARGSRTFRISESFREMLPPNSAGGRNFRGYMTISSDEGLAAWLRIDTPLSRSLLRGRATEEIVPGRLAMVSHFAFGSPSLYRSELNFINVGDAAVTLDLVAQVDRGGRFNVRRTLSPGQGFREDITGLFHIAMPAVYPPLMLTGYIRIQTADGQLFEGIGDIGVTREGYAASMFYPVGPASSSVSTMPFVVNDSDYLTGYAIANPNELLTVQTDVTIELFDQDGHAVGSPRRVSLSPSARYVSLIDEKVRSGYLQIHANGPVALLGSIFTRDLTKLAQVPWLP